MLSVCSVINCALACKLSVIPEAHRHDRDNGLSFRAPHIFSFVVKELADMSFFEYSKILCKENVLLSLSFFVQFRTVPSFWLAWRCVRDCFLILTSLFIWGPNHIAIVLFLSEHCNRVLNVLICILSMSYSVFNVTICTALQETWEKPCGIQYSSVCTQQKLKAKSQLQ